MNTSIAVDCWLERPGQEPARPCVRVECSLESVVFTGRSKAATRRLALPAPVNAHDHGYGVRTLDFGCADNALELWIPGLRQRPATDPYLEALVAFGRLALSGCSATMHCHNSLNAERLVEEAQAVARASAECGLRLALSCPLLDESPLAYGGPDRLRSLADETEWSRIKTMVPSYRRIADQLAAVEAVAGSCAPRRVDVQYGPIGPQWCSDLMLEAIADASARTGRRIHMHLLETRRQREWLDRRFPGGVISFLDKIGFLSPRLAVAHGVHLRPSECELLADRGVSVVTNPSANLRLRSGTAPLGEFVRSHLEFAIGLDGTGFDDDQDIWREMRLAWLLHGGTDLEPIVTQRDIFSSVLRQGATVVNQAPGRDVVVVDYGALTEDAVFDDLDHATVLLNRMSARYVTDLVVGGRHIVKDSALVSFDFDAARKELNAQAKACLPMMTAARSDARLLTGVLHRLNRDERHGPS
jgi:5-methylthioadenosine/S-adenosylhomocysteine deaminase